MKEQSHKEEMSAAIRGDFQRLRERGVSPSLVPQEVPETDESPNGHADAPEPEPEPEVEVVVDLVEEPEPPGESPEEPPAPEPAESPDAATEPRRSWVSRLAGR